MNNVITKTFSSPPINQKEILRYANGNGDENTLKLSKEMSKKYNCSVLPININELKKEDVDQIMTEILKEFPIEVINVKIPKWLKPLDTDNATIKEILDNM